VDVLAWQAQILGRAGRKPPQAPTTSAHQAQRAVAEAQPANAAPVAPPAVETAAGKKEDSAQSPQADKLPKKGSQGRVLVAVDVTQAGKTSTREASQSPGTPKLLTPVKRPVSADLPSKPSAYLPAHTHLLLLLLPNMHILKNTCQIVAVSNLPEAVSVRQKLTRYRCGTSRIPGKPAASTHYIGGCFCCTHKWQSEP